MAFWSRSKLSGFSTSSEVEESRPHDDAALLACLPASHEALSTLYERYFDAVYNYCYLRLGNRERAEDATSEVFLRLITALDNYRQGNFAAWLFHIAHSVVVDSYRRQRPEEGIDAALYLDASIHSNTLTTLDDYDDLYQALAALSEEQRAVIELQLSGWADAQIASALARSPAAVRMLRLRALQRLRELLQSETSYTGSEGSR